MLVVVGGCCCRDRVAQLFKRQASLPLAKNEALVGSDWQAFLARQPPELRAQYEAGLGQTLASLHKDAQRMVSQPASQAHGRSVSADP